jgi:hypothetical protein
MKTESNLEIENDDLICPITCEIFRDPVIAKDGHVYEREAITTWILQNGTSPLTREPLKIEDLQPDDHLRHLAAQRRHMSVFNNTHLDTVTLPASQPTSLIMTGIHPVNVHHQSNKFGCKERVLVVICLSLIFILIAVLIRDRHRAGLPWLPCCPALPCPPGQGEIFFLSPALAALQGRAGQNFLPCLFFC